AGRHFLAATAGELESDTGNPFDFVGVVNLRVDSAFLAVAQIEDLLRLAEINAAGQLTHDHDVETFDDLRLQRGRRGERRIADRRAEIRVESQVLPEPQKARFRSNLVRHVVPFRSADGCEKDSVCGMSEVHVGFADRAPMSVVGAVPDEAFYDLELRNSLAGEAVDDLFELSHHLGADAVARQ